MTDLVCMGDSLTAAYEVDPAYGWPALLSSRFGLDVKDCGICGDTTAGMLSRFESDVIRAHPRFAIILGGTNDLWWHVPVSVIRSNLFAMACQARHHQITPVIGTPPPIATDRVAQAGFMLPEPSLDACVAQLAELAEMIGMACRESGICCVDFHARFHQDKRVQVAWYLDDGLHPNVAGYRQMANLLIDQFKSEFYFA